MPGSSSISHCGRRPHEAGADVLRALTVVGVLQAAAAPLPASAATFTVNARVLCPASWLVTPNMLDPTFGTAVGLPCAGIRVVAMDADPGFDEYCGAAYTDARGQVRIRAECGDTIRPLPDVYLRIEGRSVNGFSVGVVETSTLGRIADQIEAAWERFLEDGVPIPVPGLDELRSHSTLAWLSPLQQQVRDGASLDVGDLFIGGPGSTTLSFMAARQFWAAQYTMLRLGAGTRYLPMHFNYTVNAPLPSAALALTAYDTVLVDLTGATAARASAALAGTAHEIGHVVYNTYHSDSLHWVADCLNYFCLRTSLPCASVTLALAWYEGFADFVRDYVHQQWSWPIWSWSTAPPAPGCALMGGPADVSVEGNVQGLLNNVYFGPVRPALLMAANPTSGGLTFGCADGAVPQPGAGGALECEVQVAATCAAGNLMIDENADADECHAWVDDPRCAGPRPPNSSCPLDPVLQVGAPWCPGGRVTRPGRDACKTRVPATHTLPNGNPRPRPDGTPDMTLGLTTSGGQAWFSLPTLDEVLGWVDEAGNDDHRAKEYWERRIRPWCVLRGGPRDRYCNPLKSPSFFGEATVLDPALR